MRTVNDIIQERKITDFSKEIIDISNQNLNSLEGIERFEKLKSLYCDYNNLKSLKGIENLNNLKILYIRNNQITSLKEIKNLNNLRDIFCHKNKIEDFSYLAGNDNFEFIYLDVEEEYYQDIYNILIKNKNIKLINSFNVNRNEFLNELKYKIILNHKNKTI